MVISVSQANNRVYSERAGLNPSNTTEKKPSIFLENQPEENRPKEVYFRTKDGYILHMKYNSERLETDGHTRSYFDIECFDSAGNKLSNKQMCDTLGFTLKTDYIDFNELISFNGEILTIKIPGEALRKPPANKTQIETVEIFSSRLNLAQEAFNNQLHQDGGAGKVVDSMGMLWISDNQACMVQEDLRVTNNQLKELQRALEEGDESFRLKFEEIFKVKYNEDDIKTFKEVERMYLEASEAKLREDYFKNEFSLLLSNKPLSDEALGRDSNGEYWRTSKEDVYEREFKKLAKMIGEENLNQLIKQSAGENASIEEKYNVLKSFAQIILKSLSDNTIAAGGGRSFEEVQSLYNDSYKKAFGENDILKRVYDYNKSQQKGAAMVKSVTVIATTIAAGFLSGGLAIPFATAFATMGTEVLDRATSDEALDIYRTEGLISWLEKVNEITDWDSVAIASVSSAAMSIMFMGQSYVVTKLCLDSGKSLSTAVVADMVAGTATGAGVEYLMTGEISVEGQIFSVALSILGGAVSIKSIKKANQSHNTQPQKPKFGLQEDPKKVVHENDQINHITAPDEGIHGVTKNADYAKPKAQNNLGPIKPPKKQPELDFAQIDNSMPLESAEIVKPLVTNKDRLNDVETLTTLFNSTERTKFSDPSALGKNIEGILKLTEKYPDIPKETIFNLVENPNLSIRVIDGKVRSNGFEKVVELCSKYPDKKVELLTEIGNSKHSVLDIQDIMDNPQFGNLLDIVGPHHALNNLSDGITDIGFEKYGKINDLLFGEAPPEHQQVKNQMKEKYGVEVHFDNNLDAKSVAEYSKSVEVIIQRYKEAGKKPPKNIYITEICPDGSNGVAWASKYPDCIAVKPINDPELLEHCLYHESAHLTDMVNKREDLQYQPVGTKLGIVDNHLTSVYDESFGIEMQNAAKKYISDYAAYDTNEFSAEVGAMLLEKKIIVEKNQFPDGNIETKIIIQEPFTNIDGKVVEITPTARKEIETLLDYYFSIGGQIF